jgi:hypothetical protein
MVPVVAAQLVGLVAVTVGAGGAAGGGSTFIDLPAEIHPAASFTVTSYVPGATPLNTPVVFV